ncbi:MAG TPA: glycosyltransferase [Candidatus Bathyarchaeia archaeon]|nr:glycosyltransferase [Candidatus Bathyarchaeia archaeon]
MTNLILALWITLGTIHFGIPFAYFLVMRRVASQRSYQLASSLESEPSVSIIVPTYNEASVIETKLSNIVENGYPSQKLQFIVVDSASTDGTADRARRFIEQHNLRGEVIEETSRTGKSGALNLGLTHATGELICTSDAECVWDKDALRNGVRYFSDPRIGSVSGVHRISAAGTLAGNVEGSYRSVYRTLRIGESKLSSTPIGEGEIQLFRRAEFPGFDPRVGGDDTCGALCMIEKGFRSISAEDVMFMDPAPPAWAARFRQKIRRGQHVLQAFFKHKRLLWGPGNFSRIIFPMEFFIYAVNPLLFPLVIVFTAAVVLTTPLIGIVIAAGLVLSTIIPTLRTTLGTYISNNITMIAAVAQEARGNKQLVWTKIDENRPVNQPPSQSIIAN